jgi:hypothetical protein
LVKLECPACHQSHWEIDHDSRGTGLGGVEELGYPDRLYSCRGCGWQNSGWTVREISPSAFLLQPSPSHPMRRRDFDYWAGILKQHFPDDPLVSKIGAEFRPNVDGVRARLRIVMLNRRYYLGRIRYYIEKRLGWHW